MTNRTMTKEPRLIAAAHGGDLDKVKQYLDEGDNPNEKYRDWDTPVHAATYPLGTECLEAILDAGGRVDLTIGFSNEYPMDRAATYLRFEHLDMLKERGGDIDARDKFGGCVASYFAKSFHGGIGALWVVKNGADLTWRQQKGFRQVEGYSLVDLAMEEGNYKTAQVYRDAGAPEYFHLPNTSRMDHSFPDNWRHAAA